MARYLFQSSIFAAFLCTLCLSSCNDLLDIAPPIQSTTSQDIYRTNANANSVLLGIYIDMANEGVFTGRNSMTLMTGLSSDELVPVTPSTDILTIQYKNGLTTYDGGFWVSFYSFIYRVNSAIEGISSSTTLSENIRQRLLGEAKFLRAFCYFDLVNLFGDIPLLVTTDIKQNSMPSRSSKEKVYDQIIVDLLDAKSNLTEDYIAADGVAISAERVRPNKFACSALLARVYLYSSQWAAAEAEATSVIQHQELFKLESLTNAFLKDSKEAIWQLQPVGQLNKNTLEAGVFILSGDGGNVPGPNSNSKPVYLSPLFTNSFEPGDNRKDIWVDSVNVNGMWYSFISKYKYWLIDQPPTEYLMVLRLAELFLVRAEARAHQGKLVGNESASNDINEIRSRAGLDSVASSEMMEILNYVYKERRIELSVEFGHRWFDLKRLNKIDEVMAQISGDKGTTWSSYKSLFPIPVSDIQRNPNLRGQQNPGYPEQ